VEDWGLWGGQWGEVHENSLPGFIMVMIYYTSISMGNMIIKNQRTTQNKGFSGISFL
jgi:hypothetical protein